MTTNYDLYNNNLYAISYLKDSQCLLYQMYDEFDIVTTQCHRRWGKGTTTLVYTFELCARKKIIARYGAETQLQAHRIIDFLVDQIYLDCPNKKPEKKQGGYYYWPETGSKFYIFGCKDRGEADKARGEFSDIIILDEFAFWKYRPEYMLKSVLLPQLKGSKIAKCFITSTPPEDLAHYYVFLIEESRLKGTHFKWTIIDSIKAGEITEAEHQRIIDDCGGINSEAYRREYLCELIPSGNRLVIPEAQNEELYVGKQNRPENLEYFVMYDFGFHDFTAALFGYLDFKEARFIVEYELIVHYLSTRDIVEQARDIENNILKVGKIPIRRMGDCADLQQLHDMSKDHDYQISPIHKRSKQSGKGFRDSVINQLRLCISNGQLLINQDTCPITIMSLKCGIWNENRTDFHRSEKLGHLDALMALAYMIDNVDWSKNPYPILSKHVKEENYYIPEALKKANGKQALAKLAGK